MLHIFLRTAFISSLRYDRLFVGIKVVKRDAGPFGDAVDCVVGDLRFDTRAAQYQLGKVAQEAAAACHGDARVDDIGRELGRRLLQNIADGFDYLAQLFAHRFDHVVGAQLAGAREPGDKVAAAHRHHQLLLHRHGRADVYFDVLGGLLSYRQVVRLFYIVGDGAVELVARAFDGGGSDDAAEADNRHVGRAAADVHHHVPLGLLYRDAGADSREHRLFDHVGVFGARADGGLHHSAALGRSDAGRHADHDIGLKKLKPAGSFLYKIFEHR